MPIAITDLKRVKSESEGQIMRAGKSTNSPTRTLPI